MMLGLTLSQHLNATYNIGHIIVVIIDAYAISSSDSTSASSIGVVVVTSPSKNQVNRPLP